VNYKNKIKPETIAAKTFIENLFTRKNRVTPYGGYKKIHKGVINKKQNKKTYKRKRYIKKKNN
jgi:hypothetical protein